MRVLSGDYLWVHLSGQFVEDFNQPTYLTKLEAPQVGDMKRSIRAELIDRRENFDFEGISTDPVEKKEKPNSPANNPSAYSNVMLHSGELVWREVTEGATPSSDNPETANLITGLDYYKNGN